MDIGYLRLTEGNQQENECITDRDNTLRYLGVSQKRPWGKWRCTYFDYQLSTTDPFPEGHAGYKKYYAYGKKFKIVNTYFLYNCDQKISLYGKLSGTLMLKVLRVKKKIRLSGWE
jgi:hypothetical protein